MKFKSRLTVVGMKSSKGTLDSGQTFDSTKAYCLVDMDGTKDNMRGQSVADFNIGASTEFDKFKHLPFPFDAEADMELVTNGSSSKTVVTALRPIADQPVKGKVA